MDISRQRPICDLFVSLYDRVFNDSGSIICDKALNCFADLQGPICYKDAQNTEMNLIVY